MQQPVGSGLTQPVNLGQPVLQQPIGQPPAGDRDSFFPKGNVSFGNIPEQFRSGFINYLKENPNSFGFGGQAITPVGLPGGGAVAFGDTGSAGAFRKYLESTGFTPPSPLQTALGFATGLAKGGMPTGIVRTNMKLELKKEIIEKQVDLCL